MAGFQAAPLASSDWMKSQGWPDWSLNHDIAYWPDWRAVNSRVNGILSVCAGRVRPRHGCRGGGPHLVERSTAIDFGNGDC